MALKQTEHPPILGNLVFVIRVSPEDNDLLFKRVVGELSGRRVLAGTTLMGAQKGNRLVWDIFSATRATMGRVATVTEIRVKKGSVILTVALGAFAVYEGFSRYDNFVKSVTLLRGQIENILVDHFQEEPISILKVESSWKPEPDPETQATSVKQPSHR